MYKRAFSHVHDTNKGDDTSFRYYVWQLGYGLFPWSGLCAAGTLYCVGKSTSARAPAGVDGRGDGSSALVDLTYFCVLWQLAAFGMFAITGTKYHHYVLPLVPAATTLAGVFCHRALQRSRGAGDPAPLAGGAVALAAAAFVFLAGRDLAVPRSGDVEGDARLMHLFTYNYSRSWPTTLDYSTVLWAFTGVGTALCLGMLARRWRRACVIGFGAFATLVAVWGI